MLYLIVATLWGALENLNLLSLSVLLKQATDEKEEIELSSRLTRYSRLVLMLTFKACQMDAATDKLDSLVHGVLGSGNTKCHCSKGVVNTSTSERNNINNKLEGNTSSLNKVLSFRELQETHNDQIQLLTEEERQWLLAATPGTRPLMVISWIDGYFNSLKAAGYQLDEVIQTGVMMNLFNVRYKSIVNTLLI